MTTIVVFARPREFPALLDDRIEFFENAEEVKRAVAELTLENMTISVAIADGSRSYAIHADEIQNWLTSGRPDDRSDRSGSGASSDGADTFPGGLRTI